jgi:hypothetical protein
VKARKNLGENQRKIHQEWRELALFQMQKRHFNARL